MGVSGELKAHAHHEHASKPPSSPRRSSAPRGTPRDARRSCEPRRGGYREHGTATHRREPGRAEHEGAGAAPASPPGSKARKVAESSRTTRRISSALKRPGEPPMAPSKRPDAGSIRAGGRDRFHRRNAGVPRSAGPSPNPWGRVLSPPRGAAKGPGGEGNLEASPKVASGGLLVKCSVFCSVSILDAGLNAAVPSLPRPGAERRCLEKPGKRCS
jgi:hypothetical protein